MEELKTAYSDELIQNQYEQDFIISTESWLSERIENQREPHGVMVIDGDSWNEHVREDTGGALNARDLWRDTLWDDMVEYLVATHTLETIIFDVETFDIVVTW